MQVIPAIDLLEGKAVRLTQGKRETVKVYSSDPLALALDFAKQGAQWLHLVDLDACFGLGSNASAIKQIVSASGASVQTGGGVKSARQAKELCEIGVKRVIVGTAAIDDATIAQMSTAIGESLWIACDVKDGKVAVSGWERKVELTVDELLDRAKALGAGGIIVTDISRDGTAKGISRAFFSAMRQKTSLPLIAAGGIGSLENLRELGGMGYDGAIVGLALYEGNFTYAEAKEAVENVG
jgi:phosphoribosylformimino-5-aminoimidazole carboxamide ribotide isomerase